MIEAIEIPLGNTKIRAFADSEMVLYCTKIDSSEKLKLDPKEWKFVNSCFNNHRREAIENDK